MDFTDGHVVSAFIGGGFIIPWAWFTLGVVSGFYPAVKASNLWQCWRLANCFTISSVTRIEPLKAVSSLQQ